MEIKYNNQLYNLFLDRYFNNNLRIILENINEKIIVSTNICKLPEQFVAIDTSKVNIDKILVDEGILEYITTTIPIDNKQVPIYKIGIESFKFLYQKAI